MTPVGQDTAQLTQAEVWMASELLRALTLCQSKLSRYEAMARDPQVQELVRAGLRQVQDQANRCQDLVQPAEAAAPRL